MLRPQGLEGSDLREGSIHCGMQGSLSASNRKLPGGFGRLSGSLLGSWESETWAWRGCRVKAAWTLLWPFLSPCVSSLHKDQGPTIEKGQRRQALGMWNSSRECKALVAVPTAHPLQMLEEDEPLKQKQVASPPAGECIQDS